MENHISQNILVQLVNFYLYDSNNVSLHQCDFAANQINTLLKPGIVLQFGVDIKSVELHMEEIQACHANV